MVRALWEGEWRSAVVEPLLHSGGKLELPSSKTSRITLEPLNQGTHLLDPSRFPIVLNATEVLLIRHNDLNKFVKGTGVGTKADPVESRISVWIPVKKKTRRVAAAGGCCFVQDLVCIHVPKVPSNLRNVTSFLWNVPTRTNQTSFSC